MQRARRQLLARAGRPDDQDAAIGLGGALDGRDRGFDIAVPGDHHDRHLRVVLFDLFQQLQPVELAALQPDVEKHQMRAAGSNFRERRIAVARGSGVKALVLQNTRNQIANIGFVIDNQNVICHRSRLSGQPPVAASILDSLLVASARSAVSGAVTFVSAAGSLTSTFAAWPDTANRNLIQAPRAPGRMSAASLSSIRPPWSSRTRPTIARPRPVPFSRVVT